MVEFSKEKITTLIKSQEDYLAFLDNAETIDGNLTVYGDLVIDTEEVIEWNEDVNIIGSIKFIKGKVK